MLFIPLVISHRIILEGDSINYFYAYGHYLQSHTGLAWNQYLLSGFPMPATYQFGFFNPLYITLYKTFGFINGYHLLTFIFIYANTILSYFAFKSFRISREGSLLAAIAYTFGQATFWWSGNLAVVASLAVLPACFLSVSKFFSGNWKFIFLLGPIVGLSLLGAHYQWILYALIAGSFYALYLAWLRFKETRTIPFKPLGFLVWSALVAFVIALPQLIYSIRFTALSFRLGGVGSGINEHLAALPLDLIRYILPAFQLRGFNSEEFLPYIGFIPFALAVLAAIYLWRKDRLVAFFSGLVVLCLLISMQHSPLALLLSKLPVLKYFRGPARWMTVGSFALAALAGYGFDLVKNNLITLRSNRFLRVGFFIVIAGILAANILYIIGGDYVSQLIKAWFDNNLYAQTTGLPLEHYHKVIDDLLRQSFGNIGLWNLKFLIPALSIVAGVVVLRRPDKKLFTLLVIGLTIFNVAFTGYSKFSFGNADLLEEPPEISEVIHASNSDPHTYRVFSFLIGFAGSQKVSDIKESTPEDLFRFLIDGLAVNTNLYWDIPTIDGYEPLGLTRNQKILAIAGSETTQAQEDALAAKPIPLESKLSEFTSRLLLLSMLNVKYLISAYQLPATPGLNLIHTASSTRFKIPIYLYENTQVLPRVYLANSITHLPDTDEEKNFSAIIASGIDFKRTTFLECPEACQPNNPSSRDTLTVTAYADGLLNANIRTEKGRWLVFSESNLPGWHAAIDNQPTPIITANYLFQAIYVPSGDHAVRVGYELFNF